MVEVMASEPQPPDYFVSHFWGEGICDFLRCLVHHAWERGLESKAGYHDGTHIVNGHPGYLGGRSPRYWVRRSSSIKTCHPLDLSHR